MEDQAKTNIRTISDHEWMRLLRSRGANPNFLSQGPEVIPVDILPKDNKENIVIEVIKAKTKVKPKKLIQLSLDLGI